MSDSDKTKAKKGAMLYCGNKIIGEQTGLSYVFPIRKPCLIKFSVTLGRVPSSAHCRFPVFTTTGGQALYGNNGEP
jgi:hypothetical protein